MVLSVDPGKHHHGFALWEKGELAAAWMGTTFTCRDQITSYAPFEALQQLVIEVPQIYSLSRSKGGLKGQNDLLDLAFAAGGLENELGLACLKFRPREWKGQVPKDIMVRRIQKKLSSEETDRVELPRAESKHHNVWDAIGVGLKYWRRL